MILELLFNLLFGLVDFLVSLIPTFNINLDFGAILAPLAKVFGLLGNIIDLKVVAVCVGVIIVRDNYILLKDVLVAVIHKIPFIN